MSLFKNTSTFFPFTRNLLFFPFTRNLLVIVYMLIVYSRSLPCYCTINVYVVIHFCDSMWSFGVKWICAGFFIICLYMYYSWWSSYQEGRVEISLTGITLPHCCACSKTGFKFPNHVFFCSVNSVKMEGNNCLFCCYWWNWWPWCLFFFFNNWYENSLTTGRSILTTHPFLNNNPFKRGWYVKVGILTDPSSLGIT